MSKLRVMLADDHLVVREGLKALINREADMEVVGEVSDGLEVTATAERTRPNVVVMDVSMPHLNGMEATRQLRETLPETRVLALSMHEDRMYIRRMLEAGAAGYVVKRAMAAELLRAIRAVAAGALYVDPHVAGHLESLLTGQPHGPSELTPRETEVLRLIAQGFSNKEIAARLGIAVKTVETHRARAMEKLGLQSRAGVVRLALERGWLHEGA
ncbi:MAG TPA: response regulator transcription factor [Gemmatimonadales bacterium]|nr:response regulator transcription factor [Gemmatimonadales bacterium]